VLWTFRLHEVRQWTIVTYMWKIMLMIEMINWFTQNESQISAPGDLEVSSQRTFQSLRSEESTTESFRTGIMQTTMLLSLLLLFFSLCYFFILLLLCLNILTIIAWLCYHIDFLKSNFKRSKDFLFELYSTWLVLIYT